MEIARLFPVLLLAAGLSACIPATRDQKPAETEILPTISGACDAGKVQGDVGKSLDYALGETMRREAGANILRIALEGSSITMDYNPGRLNIFHDSQRKIVRINCG